MNRLLRAICFRVAGLPVLFTTLIPNSFLPIVWPLFKYPKPTKYPIVNIMEIALIGAPSFWMS